MSVYDRRMEEIARQRQDDRAGLDRIEESTQTINRGMANPVVWLILLGSLVAIPFTGGLSFGGLIVAILMMTGGGKAYAQAIPPTTADLVYPKAGCARMLAALGALVVLLVITAMFLLIVVANVEVQR